MPAPKSYKAWAVVSEPMEQGKVKLLGSMGLGGSFI